MIDIECEPGSFGQKDKVQWWKGQKLAQIRGWCKEILFRGPFYSKNKKLYKIRVLRKLIHFRGQLSREKAMEMVEVIYGR